MSPHDEDDEVVPIPLDSETIKRLARLGRIVGKHPIAIATQLLHDILQEDEDAHILAPRGDLN